jgi:hypothetical protein
MPIPRRIAVGALALLLLAGVPTVRADQTTQKSHTRGPVNFTLNAGSSACTQIQATLTGSGTFDNDFKVTTFPNGSRQVIDDKEASGKAVDPSGKSYKFIYRHHAVLSEAADGSVVHVDMADTFSIKEKDRPSLVRADFHWLWTYVPGDASTVPTATNMPWPPSDNWVQLETAGDPLNCDPI